MTGITPGGEWRLVCSGTGSEHSAFDRAMPSTVITAGDMQFLIDCGDGTARHVGRLGYALAWDALLVTAARAEQMAGILALARQVRHLKRRNRLPIYGPVGTVQKFEGLAMLDGTINEFFEAIEIGNGSELINQGGIHVKAVALESGKEPRLAYVFYEDNLPGRVDAAKARLLGIQGIEFSRLQQGQTVRGVHPKQVIGPPRTGRRLVVAGSTRPCLPLEDAMQGADAALLSTPFMDERFEVAVAIHTMTGWEAASMATRTGTKLVLLHQLAGNVFPTAQGDEARQFHHNLLIPSDGDSVVIPVSDRGDPQFFRGGANRLQPKKAAQSLTEQK